MMAVIKIMKEKIPNHPVLKKEMEKLMASGFSQDESLNIMIDCGADYCAVTGKEKYSWSNYYLRRA